MRLTLTHAVQPHCHHAITVWPMAEAGDQLLVTCDKCKKTLRSDVTPELVPAAVLVFHSAHEGHPLRVEYRGQVWRSPTND